MKEQDFPRWQTTLCTLYLLSCGLFLRADSLLPIFLSTALLLILCPLVFRFSTVLRKNRYVLAMLSIPFIVLSLYRLYGFLHTLDFHALSFCVFFLLTAWILSNRGVTRLAMWSLPTAWCILLLLSFSVAVSVPDWIFCLLTRVRWFDSVLLCHFLSVFLLAICFDKPDTIACAKGFALGGLMLSILCLRALFLLGAHGAASFSYPIFTSAGIASIGDLLQRSESIFVCALLLCVLGQVSALFSVIRHKK